MQIGTGIYLFPEGTSCLCFVDGLELDYSRDELRVHFHPLYRKSLPFSVPIKEFAGTVAMFGDPMVQAKRFKLVRQLPAKWLHVLLPGTTVGLGLAGIPCIATHQVLRVYAEASLITVALKELCCESEVNIILDEYLEKFQASAE